MHGQNYIKFDTRVLKKAPGRRVVWGGGGHIAPYILNLSIRWRRVLKNALATLFPGEGNPVPTGHGAGWAPKPHRTLSRKEMPLPITKIKPRILHNLMFFWPWIIVLTFSNYQLNAQFLYSSTIYMLHYDPQHVSSSTLLILRWTNCITTALNIVIVFFKLPT